MKNTNKKNPIMEVGRYAGKPVDSLPNSYLRWVIMQDFEPEILEAAKRKLEQSQYDNTYLNISRHAVDMFSVRFLSKWLGSEAYAETKIGLNSFITKLAERAWELGEDVSKNRHQDDGIVKEYEGIRFVFAVSEMFPDYKDVITIMGE